MKMIAAMLKTVLKPDRREERGTRCTSSCSQQDGAGKRFADATTDGSLRFEIDGQRFAYRLPLGSLLRPRIDPVSGESFPRQLGSIRTPATSSTRALPPSDHDAMSSRYNAADIEVLSGLDPVKRRPGIYTDTAARNHLAQEVIDNAVDEALAGMRGPSRSPCMPTAAAGVADDGRGMPVDIHPGEDPGVG